MNEPLARSRGGVHAAARHDSAVGHVTGAARYLDDVPTVTGTLEAALVLSPHAHARIRRIDLARALAAPGVIAAITAADIPGKNDIAPIRSDEPALAADVVEYEGQPVAAIAAGTFDQARAAARLVEIDYEPLPSVTDLPGAVLAGAPSVWGAVPTNVCFTLTMGDAAACEKAFASACHRVRLRLVNNRVTASPMEPRGAVGIGGVVMVSENPADHRHFIGAFAGVDDIKSGASGICAGTPRGCSTSCRAMRSPRSWSGSRFRP